MTKVDEWWQLSEGARFEQTSEPQSPAADYARGTNQKSTGYPHRAKLHVLVLTIPLPLLEGQQSLLPAAVHAGGVGTTSSTTNASAPLNKSNYRKITYWYKHEYDTAMRLGTEKAVEIS